MSFLVDSYSESNYNSYNYCYSTYRNGVAQSFTPSGSGNLLSCNFYLRKYGSPTGNVYAKLYAHTGTFGTSSTPIGSALATSDAFDVSTLSDSVFTLITFNFTGAEQYTLTGKTYYCIAIWYDGGDPDNYLWIGGDNSSPTHNGNESYYRVSPAGWVADSARDCCFYVYAEKTGPFPIHFRQ